MLRKWDFNIDVYKEVAAWLNENEGASANDAALWWLNSKADLWKGWVTSRCRRRGPVRAGWEGDPRRLAGGVALPPR